MLMMLVALYLTLGLLFMSWAVFDDWTRGFGLRSQDLTGLVLMITLWPLGVVLAVEDRFEEVE